MIVVFEKGLVLRHIGHLDLMRSIQRALRRSGLPVRYSNGFNPHIQLSFASPLSVGVAGMREVMDIPLESECDEAEFTQTLARAMPAPLKVRRARAVPDTFPTLMALVAGSNIRMELDAGQAADAVAAALPPFMASDDCVALRKTKSGENSTNIRPFVTQASVEPSGTGYTLRCVIANRAEGSLKPSVLMKALCDLAGVEAVPYLAYRDAILARAGDGALIALEEYPYV